jgi:protein SCO1
MSQANRLRRRVCQMLALTSMSASPFALAGSAIVNGVVNAHGYINPPLLLQDFPVSDSEGKVSRIHDLLRHHVTAIQMIFTGCSNVCPIQGATFRQLQDLLPQQSPIQLLSLSIDPLNDRPQELKLWLKKFHPKQGWLAATPDLHALTTVRAMFNFGQSDLNSHLTEVQLVNRSCELVWRSSELPAPEALADKLLALV